MNQLDIEVLYREKAAHFVGLAHWVVGSRAHAEEIVNDVFVRLVAKPPKLRDSSALEGYVRTAVINGGRGHIRRRMLEQRHARTICDEGVEDPHTDHALRSAVLSLPIRQRQCVTLRFYEDMTVDQIADVLGLASGTVKSHLHRGLAALEHAVQQEGIAP